MLLYDNEVRSMVMDRKNECTNVVSPRRSSNFESFEKEDVPAGGLVSHYFTPFLTPYCLIRHLSAPPIAVPML